MGERPGTLTRILNELVRFLSRAAAPLSLDREKKGELMSLRLKYLDILSGMLPAGALGVSLLLGSTGPCGASEHPMNSLPAATQGVSERLAAIREAVSELGTPTMRSSEGEQQLAWGKLVAQRRMA